MITVLQIIPTLGAGGAEQACVDIAGGLRAKGHRAIVVSSGGSRVLEVQKAGGEFMPRPVNSKNPIIMGQNALWLEKLIKEQRIDIVHARSRAPAWSAYGATRMTPCHFVTTFHAAYKFSNPFKRVYNSVMAKSDRIISISDFVTRYIKDSYGTDGSKIRLIPRGIDFDRFDTARVTEDRLAKLRAGFDMQPDEKIILMPSRLSPIKGQSLLIEALAALPRQFADVRAVIVGDEQGRLEYRLYLENLIAMHNLQRRIKIVPHCNDMPAAYSLAACIVAPSVVPEGFGRVPVEAMAMGVPVIATNIGAFAETIKPGETGWLVPPHDAKTLSDALATALSQTPEQRAAMASAGIAHVRALYDKRKMVADTIAVYEELAGRSP
jgi:glycosyltransferase involved in cell wall biosynthesis